MSGDRYQWGKYTGMLVEIMYMNHKGVVSQRRVRILEVQGHLLRAYCYAQQAPRVFHTDRILALVPSSVPTRKHVGQQLSTYQPSFNSVQAN